ncbi:hypothetical protein P153DRAFT_391376 [Dothidotthia symphoricarpi CBS 119687]|uniref:Uncharacterized protein n=1 Tax=Dothidotthia symphoricarpi CBS 119687 TaxID=1392245 RepID=A0A6A5ZVU4_9PLEO|nr:uncharacterized protein P153DRAFT_391376 [Dothidotthia symphoricarpi CBS 119687]KAF2123649.1 hypothetical protein P153DRAFT_391376 [Dothidotthia symphoricarpi CBS 119687]
MSIIRLVLQALLADRHPLHRLFPLIPAIRYPLLSQLILRLRRNGLLRTLTIRQDPGSDESTKTPLPLKCIFHARCTSAMDLASSAMYASRRWRFVLMLTRRFADMVNENAGVELRVVALKHINGVFAGYVVKHPFPNLQTAGCCSGNSSHVFLSRLQPIYSVVVGLSRVRHLDHV